MTGKEPQLETAVSGSFKFKPEIDALHEEFKDYNVTVLEPTRGWLYIPVLEVRQSMDFRPLPDERGMDPVAIERRFLEAVRSCDFLYIHNEEQHVGVSVAAEFGFALAYRKPIFIKEPFVLQNFEGDLEWYNLATAIGVVATPAEAVNHMREGTWMRYGTAAEMQADGFNVSE